MIKARINYFKSEEGNYIGRPVDFPIIASAKTLKDLNRKMKSLMKSYITFYSEILEKEDCLKFEKTNEKEFLNEIKNI